jgi:sucrose-6-phosphate hydrolase SacC (GH32 family)
VQRAQEGSPPLNVRPETLAHFDIASMRFSPSAHGVLDVGDAYASNISLDDKGRTLLWLWGRTNTPPEKSWGSVITMPRILAIAEGPAGRRQGSSR